MASSEATPRGAAADARAGFTALDGGPFRVALEQVSDATFVLREGFRYTSAAGEVVAVTPESLGETDIASIPSPLRWYVGRFGRHTLAALLHDHLLKHAHGEERVRADDLFLEALGALGVPYIRRHLMWAAVHFWTRARSMGLLVRVTTLLWWGASVGGSYTLVSALFAGQWSTVAWAALGPIPGALLWTIGVRKPMRSFRCGLWAGYGVIQFFPLAAVTALFGSIHALIDRLPIGGLGPSPWRGRSSQPPGGRSDRA